MHQKWNIFRWVSIHIQNSWEILKYGKIDRNVILPVTVSVLVNKDKNLKSKHLNQEDSIQKSGVQGCFPVLSIQFSDHCGMDGIFDLFPWGYAIHIIQKY